MQTRSTPAGWRFDNSYARLPEPLFSREQPSGVRAPRLIILNDRLAADLGLDAGLLRESPDLFAGNRLPPGAEPIAQAYAGHQFGHFTNLGDGRAILLGEQLSPDQRRFDIQLKGSGRTRYSRSGDGRAALGPMLREYLISEAMHALGIPTTCSLAVAATGEVVMREKPLPGAVLTRVAASHIRVGTFQLAAALGDRELLEALLAHAIDRHDPDLVGVPDPALAFFEAVVHRQAALVARWMLVGFVHGVMNTDNMAVCGETIDYGPCAFIDTYDPATVFSSIDHQGRYAFANQPAIAQWNLARLAESLLPLVKGGEAEAIEAVKGVLEGFAASFSRAFLEGGRAKLGLVTADEGDAELFSSFLAGLRTARADYTSTCAGLAELVDSGGPTAAVPTGITAEWRDRWRARLARESATPADVVSRLRRANPAVIPRNHLVEEALAAADLGDMEPFTRLLTAVRDPFSENPHHVAYRQGPPAGCGPYRTFCGT